MLVGPNTHPLTVPHGHLQLFWSHWPHAPSIGNDQCQVIPLPPKLQGSAPLGGPAAQKLPLTPGKRPLAGPLQSPLQVDDVCFHLRTVKLHPAPRAGRLALVLVPLSIQFLFAQIFISLPQSILFPCTWNSSIGRC